MKGRLLPLSQSRLRHRPPGRGDIAKRRGEAVSDKLTAPPSLQLLSSTTSFAGY